MNWIRVAVTVCDDPAILAIAETLKISPYTMVGHWVGFLTKLPTHANTGDVSGVSDAVIEQWAGWRGKRGAFAKALRAQLVTPEGVVRGWDKHNGAAIRRAEADIERKRNERGRKTSSGQSADVHPDGARTSSVDETRRDELLFIQESEQDVDVVAVTPTTPKKRPRAPEPVVRAFESCAHTVLPHHYDALAELLETVPSPGTWAGIITGMHDGLSAPNNRPTEPARLGAAIEDFVASGKHKEANPGLFRGFVARAKAPPSAQTGYTDLHTMRADDLRALRVANERRRQLGQKVLVEPADAASLDALFPDGRTRPPLVAA
jgi:hypothetical protein